MVLLLATIVGPIALFLMAWVVATAYRLYFPEEPQPYHQHPVMIRERARAAGRAVPVGVREIQADQRYKRRREEAVVQYHYAWDSSDGFPEAWREELWARRN
ncbi:hypothetical protein [Salisaeta longa]|uniref:hypothetical protein n=1 Tax=Salisaeta longa TaxID=503170 RepID=UPI000686EF4F|nr:hypothetical protein [Salisaeta longa]